MTVGSSPLVTYIDGVDGSAAHAGAINIWPFRCTPGSGAVGRAWSRRDWALDGLPPVAFGLRLGLYLGMRGLRVDGGWGGA